MERKFDPTPSPWRYDHNHRTICGGIGLDKTSDLQIGGDFEGCEINSLHHVCEVIDHHVYSYTKGSIERSARNDVIERARNRDQSNANLLTAAPELLEELKRVGRVTHMMSNPSIDISEIDWVAVYSRIEAAIAKVEGTSN